MLDLCVCGFNILLLEKIKIKINLVNEKRCSRSAYQLKKILDFTTSFHLRISLHDHPE